MKVFSMEQFGHANNPLLEPLAVSIPMVPISCMNIGVLLCMYIGLWLITQRQNMQYVHSLVNAPIHCIIHQITVIQTANYSI